MLKTLIAATIATATLAVTAEARPYYVVEETGYGSAPAYEHHEHYVPEAKGFYFKRAFQGSKVVVQQCYKRKAWTAEGDLTWTEVCQ